MKILYTLLFLFPFISTLHAEEDGRPSKDAIQEVIAQLADEEYAVRTDAQKKLGTWVETYPRFMLLAMAAAYGDAEDIEIEIRLRELMKPLARLYLHSEPRGYLGVHLGTERIGNEITAVILRRVLPNESAEAAGLKDNDLVLMMNGETMDEMGGQGGFSQRIAETTPGTVLELAVKRENKEFLVRVIVGIRPMSARERASTVGSFDAQYLAWLQTLRPDRSYNGLPVGHFPLEEKKKEAPPAN